MNQQFKIQVIKGMFFGLLLSVTACNAGKENSAEAPVIDKEKIKQEIQAKENEYAAIYNSGELKSISYYAEDATVYAQNREPVIGKDSILAYLKQGLDESPKGNKITFTTNEVFVSNDAIHVVELGSFKLVDSVSTVLNTGNYMILFEKRDGNYVSVREMSTSDMPLE